MTFTILKGTSSNNVLRKFADDLCDAFIHKGYESKVLDLTDNNILDTVISNEFLVYSKAILTFNCLLGEAYRSDTNMPFFAELPIPYIGWLVDDPLYHMNRLKPNILNRYTLCPSEHHLKHISLEKINSKNHILLAGTTKKEALIEYKDRPIDILIAASYMGEPDLNIQSFPEGLYRILLTKTLEQLSNDNYVRVIDAMINQARRLGYDLLADPNYLNVAMQIHLNERRSDRIKIIKFICDTDFKITIVGQGWEKVIPDKKNINFVTEINSEDLDHIVSKSKVVLALNSSNGACERVFNAMSYGCCVLADHSTTLENYFKDGKDIIFYGKNKFNNLGHTLDSIFESNMGETIAGRSLKKVESNHLWTNRVDTLVDLIC